MFERKLCASKYNPVAFEQVMNNWPVYAKFIAVSMTLKFKNCDCETNLPVGKSFPLQLVFVTPQQFGFDARKLGAQDKPMDGNTALFT